MSNLARWVQNANHSLKRSLSTTTSASGLPIPANSTQSLNKNWIHPPDVLLYARVEYTVKFLGDRVVDQPKGTEVIKNTITKLRFDLSTKRSQGYKLPRVELHVNLEGLTIVDAKTKMVLYKYPLHRISFCADDKSDKRLFAFIAKQSAESDEHRCFVFLSDKLAEEITLTIGQAFDLAYRKFRDENNGRDLELKKLVVVYRQRIAQLEQENETLKQMLAQQQRMVSHQANSTSAMIPPTPPSQQPSLTNWESFESAEAPLPPSSPVPPPPLHLQAKVPPPLMPRSDKRNAGAAAGNSNLDLMKDLAANGPDVGKRLENLQLSHMEDIFDQDFDPRAGENGTKSHSANFPMQSNGVAASSNQQQNYMPTIEELEQAIFTVDSKMAEMRDGFKRGLDFGNDDFQMSDFDPNTTQVQSTGTA